MLQNLLAERFKLTLHRKEGLAHVRAGGGKERPKMKESVDEPAPRRRRAQGSGRPMAGRHGKMAMGKTVPGVASRGGGAARRRS